MALDRGGARRTWRSTAGRRRSSSRPISGTSVEQAKKSLPGIARRDFIAVGGDAPGCSRYEDDFLGRARARRSQVDAGVEEDAAVVIYTSGTTGKPKGAVRKFPKDAMHASMQFIGETPMRVDDVHLVTCPLYHSTAFGFLAFTALLGGTVGARWTSSSPSASSQLVERHGVTTTAVVPTMLHRVLALGPSVLAKYDVRSMRGDLHGRRAAARRRSAPQLMDHFGDVLFNFYGATETGLVTMAKPDDLRAAPGLHRQGAARQRDPPARRRGARGAAGRGRRALRAQQDARRRLPQRRASRRARA